MYSLSKIVLGVLTDDDSDYEFICDNLMKSLTTSIRRDKHYVSKGHQLTLDIPAPKSGTNSKEVKLKVLDCQPWSHGAITVETEIVLTKSSPVNVPNTEPVVTLMVSDFAKGLEQGPFSSVQTVQQDSTLHCVIVTDSSQLIREHHPNIDYSNVVGLSRNSLMKLGLFNDSLVCITAQSQQSCAQSLTKRESKRNRKLMKQERVARVLMIDCPEDTALMLPTLYFNLTRQSGLSQRQNSEKYISLRVRLKTSFLRILKEVRTYIMVRARTIDLM